MQKVKNKFIAMTIIISFLFNNLSFHQVMALTIDQEKPQITITGLKDSPTNRDITLLIKAEDEGSGIKNITLPDGTEVTEKTTTYTIIENGTYTFKATDQVGNEVEGTVDIDNIDKIKPTLTLEPNTLEPTNQDVIITARATDNESGIKEIILPDGEVVSDTTATFTVSENGSYTFLTRDNAGNETEEIIEITNINRSLPNKGIIKVIAKNVEGRVIKTLINNDLNLTLQVVNAPKIPGYLLTSSRTITVWLKPSDHSKEVTFIYKLDSSWEGWENAKEVVKEAENKVMDTEKTPTEQTKKEAQKKIDEAKDIIYKLPGSKEKEDLLKQLDNLQDRLNKIIIRSQSKWGKNNNDMNESKVQSENQKPEIENISLDIFVARWKGHKPISKEPIYAEKTKPIFEIDKKQLDQIISMNYSPRMYVWNTEKEKWVALATQIDENKIKSYSEVDGYVAVFAVKQPIFTDVTNNDWFAEITDRANGFAIVEGFKEENGTTTLRPEKTISKAEFYTMATRIFGAVPEGQTSLYNILPHINYSEGEQWYKPYVETLYKKGLLEEQSNLDQEIQRIEAMDILTKLVKEVEDVKLVDCSKFADMKNYPNIEIANIIKGYDDGTLRPTKHLTRAEALTLIINSLETLGW